MSDENDSLGTTDGSGAHPGGVDTDAIAAPPLVFDPLELAGVREDRPQPEHPTVSKDRRLRVISGPDAGAHVLLEKLDGCTVRIELPHGHVPWRVQVLAVALVDLLGRLFPRLDVACDPTTTASVALPPGPDLLIDRLAEAATNGGLDSLPAGHPTVVIRVGTHPSDAAIESAAYQTTRTTGAKNETADPPPLAILHADGRGWTSYNGVRASRLPDDDDESSPIGSLTAACRASAQATSLVLGTRPADLLDGSVYASALIHEVASEPLDSVVRTASCKSVEILLVGAGSIGGAAAYALARVPGLHGSITVADPQHLEAKNLDRALLATHSIAAAEAAKAQVAVAALTHQGDINAVAWEGTVEDWLAAQPQSTRLPLVLAAVDSLAARRAIQDCLPLNLINAACHPAEIQISGHRTGDGPCVCCLHMADVLDSQQTRKQILARGTGLPIRMIEVYLTNEVVLEASVLRGIERHRELPAGSLARYEGQTLEELRVGELLYGAMPVRSDEAEVAVAAPFVTALAGVLLAGEALKACSPDVDANRLGPVSGDIKYSENPLAGPAYATMTAPERWPGSECLCRSTRRQRLLKDRYGLA